MLGVSPDQGAFNRCIRLVIADRQPIVLHGLKSLFAAQRDFEIVASCSSGACCLEAVRNLAPDVALLSHTLPDLPVSELLGIARAENLSTRLVFFTESESDDILAAAIATGACSTISKYASPDTMLRSLRLMTARVSTSMGRPGDLLARSGKNVDGVNVEHMLGMLTHRERQIARLVCNGLSNKEIARELNVSRGTVKVHLHNIFQKLEISNRTVLATIASLQRSAGFSTFTLAAIAFAILSEAKAAAATNDRAACKDFEDSAFEPWKKVILRHIIFADTGETVVLTQKGSPIKLSQFTHGAARAEELHTAEQAVLSNFGRGYGPIGSGTPHLLLSPLLAFYHQPTSPMAQQQISPLEIASNLTAGNGGYGTFIMTAAGVLAYTLENSNAAMQALDPVETPINAFKDATSHGTTQVAAITIDVGGNDVISRAPGMVVHNSYAPLASANLGHDSAREEGNAGQVSARDAPLNCTGLVDAIYGASGTDRVEGSGGDDTIHGRTGSDTFNGGNDASIGGYGGDQLASSSGDDTFVYVSANDSNSTQFETISDFTSGRDKINLVAFGALAFLHLTSTSTSVPPHTLAWIYNPTSNETIIYVNPTDHSLDIGDAGLLEIHFQGVVSVAESDFVSEPKPALVAATLEGIDPALLTWTASDGSLLTTGSAHESTDAKPDGSTFTAGAWTMPADDGLRFDFERDRVGSIASTRLARFSGDSAYTAVDTNDGTIAGPVHVSSIETGDLLGHSGGQGQQASRPGPEKASVAAELTQPGVTLWHSNSEHLAHSAATSAMGPAEPIEIGNTTGNSTGHGNALHASKSAAAKPSAADEPALGISADRGDPRPPHSASASANGPSEPIETDSAPGNSAGHGNALHASRSPAAKPSAADESASGISADRGDPHPPHSASASANGPSEPIETDSAPGNSAGHGNALHASRSPAAKPSAADESASGISADRDDPHPPHSASASANGPSEPIETDSAPGNSAGHGNALHASRSAAKPSAADEPASGISADHGDPRPPHSASASANEPSEPLETDNAPGNSAGHGNVLHASRSPAAKPSAADEPASGISADHGDPRPPHSASASANEPSEPLETDNAPGNSAGHGNVLHASRSPATQPSAADESAELASWTGGTGYESAFHFKSQGDPPAPIEVVDLEQLDERPVQPGHAAGLAAIPQVVPIAMEEHAASHGNNGQQHASGHLPHDLLL